MVWAEITPGVRRRRWSRSDKQQIVAEKLKLEASVSTVARRGGLHPSQLFTWRRAARDGRLIEDSIEFARSSFPQSRRCQGAAAFCYMRALQAALVRCLDDGLRTLNNNPTERALRGVAIGRKSYLFAGSDRRRTACRRNVLADRKRLD
jgi:transposase-like protein